MPAAGSRRAGGGVTGGALEIVSLWSVVRCRGETARSWASRIRERMNWRAVAFDWNQARALLVTAEEGSPSAAARGLGLTQPTASRQVAAPEASLGVVRFERIGKSLTPTGRDLLARVRRMGQAATGVSLAASGHAEGTVSVTAFDAAATHPMPAILECVECLAPWGWVDLLASRALRDLQRCEADIALRHVRPGRPDLFALRLADFGVTLYASTAWLDRHGRPRSAEGLRTAPLIGYGRPGTIFPDLAARGVPLTKNNVRVASDSMVAVWEVMKPGLGIGLALRGIAALTPGVEPVLPHLPPIPVPIWIVTRRDLHASPRVRLVFDLPADAFSTRARSRACLSARPRAGHRAAGRSCISVPR